ncbi:MAG: hypothetical protein ACUVRP_05170 [Chlorobiales bacterium]
MRYILFAFVFVCVVVVPANAQNLYNILNDYLLHAERTDYAIERNNLQGSVVLYESDEDDDEYLFSGHTTISLYQTNDGTIKINTLHEFGGSGYEVKSLYLDSQYNPLLLVDELKQEFRKSVVFENGEPAIYAQAEWDADEFEFGDYTIYRITPKEYRYAVNILSEYERILQDWTHGVQRNKNKRRVGDYASMNQLAAPSQAAQAPANAEEQAKQAASSLLIEMLDRNLQKWLK